LGRWTTFYGKLEAVRMGKNLFGAGRLWRLQRRFRPFLRMASSAGFSQAFLRWISVRKIAGVTPAPRKSQRINFRRRIP
jgi:hypothetical protein